MVVNSASVFDRDVWWSLLWSGTKRDDLYHSLTFPKQFFITVHFTDAV